MTKTKKKYLITGYVVYERGYMVDAENEDEALDLAMEMEQPTYAEVVEEGFFDHPEEVQLS